MEVTKENDINYFNLIIISLFFYKLNDPLIMTIFNS